MHAITSQVRDNNTCYFCVYSIDRKLREATLYALVDRLLVRQNRRWNIDWSNRSVAAAVTVEFLLCHRHAFHTLVAPLAVVDLISYAKTHNW